MKTIIYSCILLALCSCNTKETEGTGNILDDFNITTQLTDGEIVLSGMINNPNTIEVYDSLIVISSWSATPHLTMYNIKNGEKYSWLNKGRANAEILNFTNMYKYNDSLLYVDGDLNTVLIYNVNNVSRGGMKPFKSFKYSNTAFNTTVLANDSMLIYQSKDPDVNSSTRFCTENINDKSVNYWGEYPFNDVDIKDIPADDYSRLTAYQGKLEGNIAKGKSIAYYFDAVGFDIIDNKSQEIEFSRFVQYPQVKTRQAMDATFVETKKDSKRGFIDACSTDSSIYFLYSDKTESDKSKNRGKYILKYNWEGVAVCKYVLDRELAGFTISKDDSGLYGIELLENEEHIVKYKLPMR